LFTLLFWVFLSKKPVHLMTIEEVGSTLSGESFSNRIL
jgi:hypothetical protein